MNGKIYTRQGDGGSTRRADGQEVRKCDSCVEAMGAIDELSAFIGSCLAATDGCAAIERPLAPTQQRLFEVGAILAAGGTDKQGGVALAPDCVAALERAIDDATGQLPALEQFIAPGGSELAARLHVARTVCRRAERRVVAAADGGANVPPTVLEFLNRLSDLLFTLARLANKLAGRPDAPLEA